MSQSRRPVIAGNWKMHGLLDDGLSLAKAVEDGCADAGCDVVICPPATLLHPLAQALNAETVALGAQDCHENEGGAFTGDISAPMIRDIGAGYVIVGHSERRTAYGEDDARVCAKAQAAHAVGLTAIVCIGETEEQRDAGLTMATISSQLDGSVPSAATALNTVVAYEPVWAIGTGRTATPEDAQDVHDHIRTYLASSHGMDFAEQVRILYGGSMKPSNAEALLSQSDIDGGLIGGASLKAEDFLEIVNCLPK